MRLAVAIVSALATAVVLPTASAQAVPRSTDCQWTAADVPLPAGYNHGVITATDPDGVRQAGYVWKTTRNFAVGVIWENGIPRVLPRYSDSVKLWDINASGTAIGSGSDFESSTPIRNKTGVHEPLPHLISAQHINRVGQIVGPGQSRGPEVVVLQSDLAAPPRIVSVPTDEIVHHTGIDDAGRVIATAVKGSNLYSYVWSAFGVRTQIQPMTPTGTAEAMLLKAGRIVGRTYAEGTNSAVVEWDASGQIIWQYLGVTGVEAINGTTLLVGRFAVVGGTESAVWDNGQYAGALRKPGATFIDPNAVSDDGVVFGSYKTNTHELPVRWTC